MKLFIYFYFVDFSSGRKVSSHSLTLKVPVSIEKPETCPTLISYHLAWLHVWVMLGEKKIKRCISFKLPVIPNAAIQPIEG